MEIKKDFTKEARIEFVISLKLNFDKINQLILVIGNKYTIQPKRQLFHFHRGELIMLSGFRRQIEQIEEAAGKGLEKLVENAVRFHKGL